MFYESLEFNAAGNGFAISRSYPEMRLFLLTDSFGQVGGTQYQTVCFNNTDVSEFVWTQNGNQVITNIQGSGVYRWNLQGNLLIVYLRNWLPVEVYDGFGIITVYEDVEMVYARN